MLLRRVISALILGPLILLVLYLGGLPLLALLLVAAALGFHEFCAMFRRAGQHPFYVPGMAVALAAIAASYFPPADLAPAVVTAAILVIWTYALFQRRPLRQVVFDATLTLAGALYVGWLLRYGLLLRARDMGWEWSVTALVAAWAADTGAYFAGRAFGRHRFSPRISPGKTWEGVAGGLALAVAATLLARYVVLPLAVWQSVALGIVVAVAAVAGDLAESLLKRGTGVKDSGALIPGHGGLLDRADSLLFVVPAVYYFSIWIVP